MKMKYRPQKVCELLGSVCCLLFLIGCQSTPLTTFKKIPLGASKGQVLHSLGNPPQTYRKNNTDRWIYHFGDTKSQSPLTKEIWFQGGVVVYKDGEGFATPVEKPQPKDSDFKPID